MMPCRTRFAPERGRVAQPSAEGASAPEYARRVELALLDLADGDAFALMGGVGDPFQDRGVAATKKHRLAAADARRVDRGEGDLRQVAEAEAGRPEEALERDNGSFLARGNQLVERDEGIL